MRAERSAVAAATAPRVEQTETLASCKRPPFAVPEIAPAPAAMSRDDPLLFVVGIAHAVGEGAGNF